LRSVLIWVNIAAGGAFMASAAFNVDLARQQKADEPPAQLMTYQEPQA
jgi:hypothetical protein